MTTPAVECSRGECRRRFRWFVAFANRWVSKQILLATVVHTDLWVPVHRLMFAMAVLAIEIAHYSFPSASSLVAHVDVRSRTSSIRAGRDLSVSMQRDLKWRLERPG